MKIVHIISAARSSIYLILILLCTSCAEKPNTINTDGAKLVATAKDKMKKESTNEADTKTIAKNHLQGGFSAYLDDPDKSGTNIRETPNGDILTTLIVDDLNHDYQFFITAAKDGWFKIQSPVEGVENDIEIPTGEGWIHGSVIAVDTRNYNNEQIQLFDAPENGNVLGVITEEQIRLKLIDIYGNWAKIEWNGTIGWVKSKWLCGNPLTTCT